MNDADFDNLTIGQAKKIGGMFGIGREDSVITETRTHARRPIIVCTDKRGVVFGYCDNVAARPIALSDARMCLYWSPDVGGVFGLAEKGPTKDCKISAVVPTITLEGVTAVMSVDPVAELAWTSAKVQGR